MKEIDVTLSGITLAFANGNYNQLYVTMAVSTCVMNNENGAKWNFPMPPVVMVCVEPFRQIPLNDKHALITRGAEVEFRVTGTVDELKVELVRAVERKERSLKDFVTSLQLKKV